MNNIRRVLVANRGEIALRVIRACKELGLETVAIYSEGDKGCRHVRMADRAVCIGPAPATRSYLNKEAILAVAKLTNADAIHPGYGFLAENSTFAEACANNGIHFVGPSAEAIRAMGDKVKARQIAARLGISVIPGSEGGLGNWDEVIEIARQVGYPLLLKAAAGGGGRGMQVVNSDGEVKDAFIRARAEAGAAFSNDLLYVEKYIENARHVEVQILADQHGNVVHLGERDCTIQRRHQKLLEEAPCPVISPELRDRLTAAAVSIARHIGYTSAGTVEFLVDLDQENFYFMEMNTRIQVEHPVTEMLTGVDIVQEQLRIVAGEPLSITQADIQPRGHAIECRINAEDPQNGFQPTPGLITRFLPPGGMGVRLDSHCYAGYTVPPYYDSLVAKLIVVANDRHQAIRRMLRALQEFEIEGIPTTISFHQQLLLNEDFQAGTFNTRWLENRFGKEE
ncbi:acetyl-CoA carboxylase biotin carboxylase subunit [Desulfofundulus sp. TPOSR]|uniref:acetyl-CoA carboxylase biotin carboxylase subunit n=1 Tax=Desulfofundulus sp. TPOSR TaxID=2714340 RepID=UPI00140BA0A0|nr:acetyl-CoA carboxylase biotin carboxylase subunit [Desulfofundulus sp. TPOSR]NHM28759.1 acetyl-CoA carboxylase biotin carboxylase subunit [Desulfofundulus sp. TPOSR]